MHQVFVNAPVPGITPTIWQVREVAGVTAVRDTWGDEVVEVVVVEMEVWR